jgi:hypothetical protein
VTTQERARAFKAEWEAEWERRGGGLAGAIPDVADLIPLLDAAVAEEREACARLADGEAKRCGDGPGMGAARRIAGGIRARGGKT